MVNSALEVIYSRRSIRHFNRRKVSDRIIKRIVRAGLAAPSSKNCNPWYIVVLSTSEKNMLATQLQAHAEDAARTPDYIRLFRAKAGMADTTLETAHIIANAPVLLCIFNRGPYTSELKTIQEAKDRLGYLYLLEGMALGAAMENMLLAATANGLGAVPIADLCPLSKEIAKLCRVEYEFAVAISLGHPAEKKKKRALQKDLAVYHRDFKS